MKKLSLLNLSNNALDKFQQNAVLGGGLPSCICLHICDNCGCSTEFDSAVYLNEFAGGIDVEVMADILGDNPV